MKLLLGGLLFSLLLQGTLPHRVDYSNYHIIESVDGGDLFKALGLERQSSFEAVSEDGSALLVEFSRLQEVLQELKHRHVHFRIVTKDLQRDIDLERTASTNWFYSYHRFEDMLKWLEGKAKEDKEHLKLFDIGKSFEGRPLRVLKMTGRNNTCKHKPSIWLDSGIHAREWIAHTTNSYLIEQFLEGYHTDKEVQELRDSYDFYFLVTMNPDGYVHSWDEDRLWRKSRKPVDYSMCVGTDTNRNFDHQWATIGISTNPCEQTFAGPKAFWDPEGKAVADFILSKESQWDVFLTIHSYGHLLLAPWGYTQELPENYPDLEKVGNATVRAISAVNNVNYRFGTSAGILYQSSGTSRDWAKGVAKIPYVYTFELRNNNSFVIPPSEILPTGREIWAGVKRLIQEVKVTTPPQCKKAVV